MKSAKLLLILALLMSIVPIKTLQCKPCNLNFSTVFSQLNSEEIGWHLQKININGAWEYSKGLVNITIAIIDSGIDFNHPDLFNASWINDDEIANNTIDDDNNGYIDDKFGWDFVNNDTTPGPQAGDPIHWHATFIAGIVCGALDSSGIVGVAPNVKVMDLRVLNEENYQATTLSGLGEAIKYAVDNGADVISMSLQYYSTSDSYRDDIIYAINHNIPVVSITGNTWDGGREYYSYPGAYSEVIAVGATDYYNHKADYSNYGDYIELVAPVGDDYNHLIRSSILDGSFSRGQGTSFAAPQVAGVIALMKSVNNNLTVENIRTILTDTALDLGEDGKDKYFGYGLLNAEEAVRVAGNFTSSKTPFSFQEILNVILSLSSISIAAIIALIVIIRMRRKNQ